MSRGNNGLLFTWIFLCLAVVAAIVIVAYGNLTGSFGFPEPQGFTSTGSVVYNTLNDYFISAGLSLGILSAAFVGGGCLGALFDLATSKEAPNQNQHLGSNSKQILHKTENFTENGVVDRQSDNDCLTPYTLPTNIEHSSLDY